MSPGELRTRIAGQVCAFCLLEVGDADATGTPPEPWKAEGASDVRATIGIDDCIPRKAALD